MECERCGHVPCKHLDEALEGREHRIAQLSAERDVYRNALSKVAAGTWNNGRAKGVNVRHFAQIVLADPRSEAPSEGEPK